MICDDYFRIFNNNYRQNYPTDFTFFKWYRAYRPGLTWNRFFRTEAEWQKAVESWSILTCSKNGHSQKCWTNFFIASYVDQQIAAAGVWNSTLGLRPCNKARWPSLATICLRAIRIESVLNESAPHTPCITVPISAQLQSWMN